MQTGSWSGGGKKYLALVMYINLQYVGASTFSWGRQLGGSMMIMNTRLINTAQNYETSECPCPTGGIRLKNKHGERHLCPEHREMTRCITYIQQGMADNIGDLRILLLTHP